jgi:hypothetical protein
MVHIKADSNLDEIEAIFKGISDYKSQDKYYITLLSTYNWLEMSKEYEEYISDYNTREKLKARLARIKMIEGNDKNDLRGEYIMGYVGNVKTPIFSVAGFKRFCMTEKKNKRAKDTRKYFIRLEKKYWNALHTPKEERDVEYDELNRRRDAASEKTKAICVERDECWEETMYSLKSKYDDLCGLQKSVKDIKEFTESGDNKYKTHIYLVKTYFKPVPIYIVNPDLFHENLKYKKSKKPFNLYTEEDIDSLYSDESPVLYYHIGELDKRKRDKYEDNVNYHFVTYHYVENISHLKDLKSYLNENGFGIAGVSSTYLISFVDIKKYSVRVLISNETR